VTALASSTQCFGLSDSRIFGREHPLAWKMTNSPLINPPGPSSRAEQLTRDKEAAVEHSYNSENFSGLTKLLASAEAPHLYMYCSCLQVVRETGVLMPARHPGYDTMVALKRKEGKERKERRRCATTCSKISRMMIASNRASDPKNCRCLVDVTAT
jgi:hypothetical protein